MQRCRHNHLAPKNPKRGDSWTYEAGRTRFGWTAEAVPALKQLECEQETTAAVWGDLPRSD
jgi:hypothetical protein